MSDKRRKPRRAAIKESNRIAKIERAKRASETGPDDTKQAGAALLSDHLAGLIISTAIRCLVTGGLGWINGFEKPVKEENRLEESNAIEITDYRVID